MYSAAILVRAPRLAGALVAAPDLRLSRAVPASARPAPQVFIARSPPPSSQISASRTNIINLTNSQRPSAAAAADLEARDQRCPPTPTTWRHAAYDPTARMIDGGPRARRYGFSLSAWGETSPPLHLVERVVSAWMNSSVHRANISGPTSPHRVSCKRVNKNVNLLLHAGGP